MWAKIFIALTLTFVLVGLVGFRIYNYYNDIEEDLEDQTKLPATKNPMDNFMP